MAWRCGSTRPCRVQQSRWPHSQRRATPARPDLGQGRSQPGHRWWCCGPSCRVGAVTLTRRSATPGSQSVECACAPACCAAQSVRQWAVPPHPGGATSCRAPLAKLHELAARHLPPALRGLRRNAQAASAPVARCLVHRAVLQPSAGLACLALPRGPLRALAASCVPASFLPSLRGTGSLALDQRADASPFALPALSHDLHPST